VLHPLVELREMLAYVFLAPETVEGFLHRTMLVAQLDRRRCEAREVLALDLLTDPPIRIVRLVNPLERLACAGKIVEITAADRDLDRGFDGRDTLLARRPPRRTVYLPRPLLAVMLGAVLRGSRTRVVHVFQAMRTVAAWRTFLQIRCSARSRLRAMDRRLPGCGSRTIAILRRPQRSARVSSRARIRFSMRPRDSWPSTWRASARRSIFHWSRWGPRSSVRSGGFS